MKKSYILYSAFMLLLLLQLRLNAQCMGGRYQNKIFPGIPQVTTDVQYGSNIKYDGSTQNLLMDIYEPQCDTGTNRACVIIAHGGAFATGTKSDLPYVQMCMGFAQLGYVVVSIEYRLGFPQDQYGFNSAIMRAVHDARAAVRWMRNDALNGPNTYKINPNMIFFGGPSAGGITALHLAYQDQQSELTMNCGGQPGTEENSLEGTSNNLTVPSTVNAILVISGGIRDLSWIQNSDVPAFLAHGTVDGTVPYGSGNFGGFFPIEGCSTIAPRCAQTSTTHCFKPLYGQDHVLTDPAYVDTVSVLMAQFLYHFTCGATLDCNYNAPTPTPTPSVTVSVTSGSNPSCQGSSVTFTAVTQNTGPVVPTYQWQVNGNNVGTNSATYTTTTLADGDVVNCTVNSICNYPTTTASNDVTMTIKPTGAPSVAIAITSGSNPTCAGGSVTFTATPTNGGATPTYQWKVNGSNVGTNSTTFTSTTLANGDVVTCNLSIPPASTCSSQTSAVSTGITMSITPGVTPSVTTAVTSGTNPTCAGASITFTATPVNGGSSPVYQWKVNNINVGTNSATYTSTTLNNNDVVTCTITSNATCANPSGATSTATTISIAPVSPSPTISTAITFGTNPTCAGAPVSFTATATNGGLSPTYQWQVNGSNAGTNSSSFTSSTLSNSDVVTCTITTSASCAGTPTATSSGITMNVNASVTPSCTIAVTSGSNQVCGGDSTAIGFTATATNGGSNPTYQWYLNGGIINGAQSSTYSLSSYNNNDVVTCKLVSDATCASPSMVISPGVTVTVTPLPVVNFVTSMTVCGGPINASSFSSTPSGASYTWTNSNTAIGLSASGTGNVPAFTAGNTGSAAISGTITVTPTLNSCVGTPATYTITVNPTATITQTGNTLTASSSSSYQWYLDGQPIAGATAQSHTITADGSYSVVVAENTCPSEVITVTTGIGNVANNEFVLGVYPNPNNGVFTITFNADNKEDYTLEVHNALGALISKERLTTVSGAYSGLLDITQKGKGLYTISLSGTDKKYSKRVVVY
ncbi:MAG: alpha/beta hydrolase fold domain-containing protein [Bacteroidia bacterium]